jgi:hypothetical protein
MEQNARIRASWGVALLGYLVALGACNDGRDGTTAPDAGGAVSLGGAPPGLGGVAGTSTAGASNAAGSGSTNNGGGGTNASGQAQAFESDDPTSSDTTTTGLASSTGGSASAAAPATGATGATTDASSEATRAIVEADIVQVSGDKLYALSNYSGLSVVDISVPENLRLLGRYTVRADPFEMYVRDGVAYAMYSSFPRSEYDAATGYYKSITSSRLVAIDARNPAAMQTIGSFDLPGTVSDSRMVGDIIYVVSYENGYCWRCTPEQPRTTVTSIQVADPAAIAQVEQLGFDDQRGSSYSYKRSISVTTNRLYVSGMVFDGTWGADTGHSTIQVVDISDPAGHLVLGSQVPVLGQIESRWQMDEYDGVLRVLSQSGSTWTNGPPPTVETFQVATAQSLAPLGKLTLSLPQRENLKSVRFDGTRAYAVTFLQTDPLFTLDLTDPAAPKQMGEVEMPGYLYYMEPRGERMIALGMDSGNTAGGLTVSIFDVADLSQPALLSRANFGGTWGWAPEDQDRIHKAFRIFDEVGLIVMPFSGWSYSGTSCGSYTSGVQLLDFTRDTVTTRGVVPVRGQAKRALLHGERLLAVSDDQVGSFDITDRDAPARLDDLALATIAQKTVRVGEHLVSLGLDWWTQTPQLTVTPVAGGTAAAPLATLELASALEPNQSRCQGYWYNFYGNAELFVNGKLVYVVYDAGFNAGYSTTDTSAKGSVGFAILDVTDPAQPKVVGSQVLALGQPVPPTYTNSYYYYYNYGFGIGAYSRSRGIWPSGKRMVQVGSTVVLEELVPIHPNPTNYWEMAESRAILHAIDLSNPSDIREVSSTTLSSGVSAGGLFVEGRKVLCSTYETAPASPGKVRFYLERLDYSSPANPERSRINVPGSLLAVDAGGQRVVTVDYARTIEPVEQADAGMCVYPTCQATTAFGTSYLQYAPVDPDAGVVYAGCPVACVRVDRALKLVDLGSAGATLVDTYQPTGDRIGGVLSGNDRLWLVRNPMSGNRQVDTLTGIRAGELVLTASTSFSSYGMLHAAGTKLGLQATSGMTSGVVVNGVMTSVTTYGLNELTVYDTADPADPQLVLQAELGVPSWNVRDVLLDDEYAIVSADNYGAWALPYE